MTQSIKAHTHTDTVCLSVGASPDHTRLSAVLTRSSRGKDGRTRPASSQCADAIHYVESTHAAWHGDTLSSARPTRHAWRTPQRTLILSPNHAHWRELPTSAQFTLSDCVSCCCSWASSTHHAYIHTSTGVQLKPRFYVSRSSVICSNYPYPGSSSHYQ